MPRTTKTISFTASQEKLQSACYEIKLKNFQKAEKYLRELLKYQPNSGNGYYLLVKCIQNRKEKAQREALKQGQKQLMIKAKLRADKLNPCFFHTFNNDVQIITKNIIELYQQSKQQLKRLSQLNDTKWQRLIQRFAKKKDLNTSLQLLNMFELLKKQNKQYSAHLFSTVGITYYEIGLYKRSIDNYKIAIQIKSNEYRYYNNSAILQYIFGNYQQSKLLVKKSLQLNPGYPKSLFIESFSLCKTGQPLKALQKINYSISKQQKSVMYRLKKLTILFELWKNDQKYAQTVVNQLNLIVGIIQKKQDKDSYFSNKDNLPFLKDCAKFILDTLQYRELFIDNWNKIASLLDQYLIKGHNDKYRITVTIKSMMCEAEDLLTQCGIVFKIATEPVQSNKQIAPNSNLGNTIDDLFG